MIKSFNSKETQTLAQKGKCSAFKSCEHIALRKLDMIDAATSINALKMAQENHLKKLKNDEKKRYSIFINDSWNIYFAWKGQDAYDVEIVKENS